MNAEMLYDAIGEIREELISDAEAESVTLRRRSFRALIAACFLLCFVALPVSAELRTGYVSNLLAPLYGGAQTELVDSVGVPIDASVTVGDYTLTADAVIGDRYNIAIVYSLTRADGGVMPEGICFDEYDGWSRAGGGYYAHELSEDGRTLKIIQQWSSHTRLFWFDRNFHIVCRDLILWDNGESTLLAEGEWALEFTIRYKDTTTNIPVRNLEVTASDGGIYTVKKLQLSPFGIHMDLRVPNPLQLGGEFGRYYSYKVDVEILLIDGSEVSLGEGAVGFHGNWAKETFKAEYDNMFEEPIPMEQIVGIRICDTVVPVG